jgi:hypothetical protein
MGQRSCNAWSSLGRETSQSTLRFPPTAKEALIGFILFDVSGITFFGRIVVLLILLD